MNIVNWLNENKDLIAQAIELEEIHSSNDPAEQPYKSQYAARDILHTCITNLEELMMKSQGNCDEVTYLIFSSLTYRLANNFLSTEESHSGEQIINSIYEKMENVPIINAFITQLTEKPASFGDTTMIQKHTYIPEISESVEMPWDRHISWMRFISGILLKICNTKGMLWASKIIDQAPDSSTGVHDPSFLNSFKYLGMAKRIYKTYVSKVKKENSSASASQDSGHLYDPPECLDSVLMTYLNYETPYLKYERGPMVSVSKNEYIRSDIFESDYTSTLFLLAQAFGKMSSVSAMKHRSAKYCYKTLSRQLNSLKYDPVEWALNAATLSQYYVTERGFKRARHCIAASEVILKEAAVRPTFGHSLNDSKKVEVNTHLPTTDELDATHEETEGSYSRNDSDGNRRVQIDCKMTVDNIFEESLDTMIDEINNKNSESEKIDKTVISDNSSEIKENIKVDLSKDQCDKFVPTKKLFPDPMSESRFWDDDIYEEKRQQAKADIDRCWIKYGLTILENSYERFMPDNVSNLECDIDDVKSPEFNVELDFVEKQVTCTYVNTFEEARELFLFIQKKLNEARQYYRIDNRCSDAIELICDHSKAFKALSNFENSVERKCCMHKKRIDMLTDLLKTLNQNYYQVACRTMMLEVGEIYSTMISLKASLIESKTPQDPEAIKFAKGVALKIRRLAKCGIDIYTKFLDSYRNREGVMPEIFAEDDIRPVMIAHFYMARIYSKIIEPEMSERIANLRKSQERYQFVVSYCDRHPAAAALMAGELESCRDMAVLLPHKIQKLIG